MAVSRDFQQLDSQRVQMQIPGRLPILLFTLLMECFKAATNNVAFTAGHAAVPASSTCLFGVWIDAAGTLSTSQGAIVPSGDQKPFPTAPAADLTLVGLIQVTTNSSTTFTPGSTDLGAGGVTDAYFDCSKMPSNNF